MLVNPSSALLRGLRTIAGVLCAAAFAAGAQAAGLTVLLADDNPAHAEFVRLLRESQDASSRFELVRLPADGLPADRVATGEERANAGVRTRSLRPSVPVNVPVTMAVGVAAARSAIERPGQDPLVLAMLSRLDYESLKASPALKRGDRQVGVLLREPAMADQLVLIDALLPQKRRLGVVATAESEPIVRELQRAAQGWDLQVEYAPDATSLASVLRVLVPRSDALMVLPDLIGDSQAATLSVLRAGATAGLPVFGTSDGLVRSGGLAAAVSTPGQLAQQARALGQKLAMGPVAGGVLVEAATPSTVRVNATVARGLGLRVPEERELTERVTAAR
ncbi:ABC transporter substrate-binding protein [Variovorax sp. WS11]|uniref:ABC transporter substrate-binding protein n=1 Tax=Variovorax sp. WS11 TaxID=1105204 RepID=UPI000D0D13C5|nr:ABC transporter substrate binding protein [Variovorax sp. WS11]NDZ13114.1 ABC transporter substrate-binding protein [Variovorax sp. WS11]PSL83537.1 ABC transporter substrate-binding protein [Variovorax sp. WS11]